MTAVPAIRVTTTDAVWASPTSLCVSPSTNGTNGGKCSSGCPPRVKPCPSSRLMPDRR